jgi:hypothetical protein
MVIKKKPSFIRVAFFFVGAVPKHHLMDGEMFLED